MLRKVEEIKSVFPNFSLPLLKEMAEHCIFMEFEKGKNITTPEAFVKYGMMLLEGKLKVYRDGENGESFFVYFLNPGEVCSMSVSCGLYDRQFNVKAVTEEDSLIISVPPDIMRTWLMKYPEWTDFIISSYRLRFESLLDVLDQVSFLKLDARLWNYLQRLRSNSENKDELIISHQQIASDLNSTREVISRLLKSMENEGFLETGRGKLTFLAKFDRVEF
jgi:CRP/FNR family transcriptional regulator